MPTGSTTTARLSGMRRAASTAPSAMPTAETPCSMAPCASGSFRCCSAHLSTMNCSVAPAPQKSVVTASEICPSLSRQSVVKQWAKSTTRRIGLRSWCV